jgi:hypothetical protein
MNGCIALVNGVLDAKAGHPESRTDPVSRPVAHGSLDLFADRVTVLDLVPRIGLELADAEADLLLVAIDAEDDRLEFLADGEDIARARDALGPRELGDVDKAFDPFLDLTNAPYGKRKTECRKEALTLAGPTTRRRMRRCRFI